MKIGLVIEGGGFRGVFCEGITTYFLENNIEIPYVIGVSMGAINGANYLSKQPKRNLEIIERFIDDKRYISKRNLLKTGSLFGMSFIFNDIAYQHHPFNFKQFDDSKQEMVIVTMNCESGESAYTYKSNQTPENMMVALQASTSLPFVARKVQIDDQYFLDGGITDPIPVRKALEDGCDKVIVLLTRDEKYIKEPFKGERISQLRYPKYPMITKGLSNRHTVYLESQRLVKDLEEKGQALVFRPKNPLDVGRTEKDFNKIKHAFNEGYQLAKEMHEEVLTFIKQ